MGYHPTDVELIGSLPWRVVKGGTLSAPLSSHTYDNQLYLPVLDRFLTFGGAEAQTGDRFAHRDAAGVQLRYVPAYTAQLDLVNAGFVGGPPGTNVQRNSTLGKIRPGARAWAPRDWYSPDMPYSLADFGIHTDSCTGQSIENGVDVVWFASGAGARLWRIEMPTDDYRDDVIIRAGALGDPISATNSGTYAPDLRMFVRTGNNTRPLLGWDTNGVLGVSNLSKNVDINSMTGIDRTEFLAAIARKGMGIEYDPKRGRFVFWEGRGGAVWAATPPAPNVWTGWHLEQLSGESLPRPQNNAELTADGATSNISNGVGTYGKWKYAADIDCYLALLNDTHAYVWAFKPSGWTDPRGQ